MAFGNLGPTLRILLVASCLCAPMPGYSRGDPPALCLDAAEKAAADTGVPYEVLVAIATVETGRNDQPWPWTVNFGGEGHWYDSAADAANGVDQALRDGATNIDLGCFQLNSRWHAAAFAMIWGALALYSLEGWRQERAARSLASNAGRSGTVM